MQKGSIIILIITIAVIGGLGYYINRQNSKPGELDGFAQCIKDKGAIFYGTFWCPHCQNQKKAFGRSARLLPYTECSTPDGKGQLTVCTEKEVKSYPTWVFADGTRLTGEIPLETLAEKTACELPASSK